MKRPIDNIIRKRRTWKVIGSPTHPLPAEDSMPLVRDVLEVAAWAPYHHAIKGDVPQPWRVHVLDATACRTLAADLAKDPEAGKYPGMLATASALLMVNWLPEGSFKHGRKPSFKGTLVNMEHIAAVSAFIQNVLLAATDRGLETYWSSGGLLAERPWARKLGIPKDELLLGAVFLFPDDAPGGVPGKHRDKLAPIDAWSRQVHLK
ncbi:MAG: nitroreductase family protein [Rhodothermales bacterium]